MFKIGDRVRIIPGSKYDRGIPANPSNLEGVIERTSNPTSTNYIYYVRWSNNYGNSYREGDLELVDITYRKAIL